MEFPRYLRIPYSDAHLEFRINNRFYNNSYDRESLEETTMSSNKMPNIILSNTYPQQTYNVRTILKSTFNR